MARPGCGIELTTRADQADLPPVGLTVAGPVPARPVELLTSEAELDTWRIVEVFSRTGLPFEVDLSWSSGSGSGASAQVTVARSTRICVLARSLKIQATNLGTVLNRVGVTVADGFAPTRNQWEVRGTVGEGSPLNTAIPPFAEHVRVDVAQLGVVPNTTLQLFDALGDLRSTTAAGAQPSPGVPVGGTAKLRVASTGQPTRARAVFLLSL